MLNQIRKDDLLFEGFPPSHVDAFVEFAENNNCIVSTRTPGEACEMLLRKGYDAKSFWIKSKSCNWGPMSGFLCLEPIMNKNLADGAISNLKDSLHALEDVYEDNQTSDATQIVIENQRLEWLKKNLSGDAESNRSAEGIFTYYADNKVHYQHKNPDLEVVMLKKLIHGETYWALFYDVKKFYGINQISKNGITEKFNEKINLSSRFKTAEDVTKAKAKVDGFWDLVLKRNYLSVTPEDKAALSSNIGGSPDFGHYVPLMALTNPHKNYTGEMSFLNATTGDYDLYAVWPQEITAEDRRVGGMTHTTTDTDIADREKQSSIGKVVGNISERVYYTAQMINSIIQDKDKSPVNRVFHSDEAGRPFLDVVDQAVFFAPDGKIYMVRDAKDLAAIIEHFFKNGKYACFINKAWEKELLKVNSNILAYIEWSPE